MYRQSTIWPLAALIAVLFFQPGLALATGQEGHGGDPMVAEFQSIGRGIVQELSVPAVESLFPEIPLAELRLAVERTTVRFTERPLRLRGRRVSGITYRERALIIVNLGSWNAMESRADLKTVLVMHEYLNILGVEDRTYQVSGRYLDLLIRRSRQQSARRYICSAICGIYSDSGIFHGRQDSVSGDTLEGAFSALRQRCSRSFYLYTAAGNTPGGTNIFANPANACAETTVAGQGL